MAGRYTQIQWTTAAVPASGYLNVHQPINANHIDITKLVLAPNSGTGTSRVEIHKNGIFTGPPLYETRNFAGTLIDRLKDDGTTTTEALEGEPIPYDDEDSVKQLNLRIFNQDISARTYTILIKYQEPVIAVAGNITLPGNLTIQGLAGLNVSGVNPIIDLTDVTASAKSLRVTVDNNFADLIEKTGAVSSLLRLDLANNRVGIGATPSSLFEVSGLIQPTLTLNCPLTSFGVDSSNTARIDFKGVVQPGVNNTAQIKYRMGITTIIGGYVNWHIRDMVETTPIDRLIVNWDGRVGNTTDNITDLTDGLGLCVGPGGSGLGWKIQNTGYIAAFENMNVNATCAGVLIKVAGSAGVNHILACTSGNQTRLSLLDDGHLWLRDNLLGSNAPGRLITIGRNENGLAAGALNLVQANGNPALIWSDGTGTLRIWNQRPAFTTDSGGVAVGTQTSRLETKNILREWDDPRPALDTILKTRVVDFVYKNGAYNGTRFTGIVSDWSPVFGMDEDRSFNPVSAFGYCILSIKALYRMILELQKANGNPA